MKLTLLAALVATAVSLKPTVEKEVEAFRAVAPGEAITVQGAASGVLVAQIEQGAPIDLFISASPVEMERLEGKGLLVDGSRTAIATNRLVIAVRKDLAPPKSIDDLKAPRFARIAVANVKTVPAGRYAEQSLRSSGVYDAVASRLIFGENVKQVLDYVVRGEADAGFVYATDDAGVEVPAKLHDPIVYEAGLVKHPTSSARAKAFLDFLLTPAGQAILAKAKFGPAPKAAASH